MKVQRNTLLLLACFVWSAAGFNILRIGVSAYPNYHGTWNYLLSLLVFLVFQIFVFGKLVKSIRRESIPIRRNGIFSSNFLTKKHLPSWL